MKLYRSRRDRKVCGLCGGIAEMINVDATLLRLVVVITAFFSAGTTILLYFLACLVIPNEPVGDFYDTPKRGCNWTHSPPKYQREVPHEPNIDEMMKDVEQRAMRKEIEELKARLAKYEKGDH